MSKQLHTHMRWLIKGFYVTTVKTFSCFLILRDMSSTKMPATPLKSNILTCGLFTQVSNRWTSYLKHLGMILEVKLLYKLWSMQRSKYQENSLFGGRWWISKGSRRNFVWIYTDKETLDDSACCSNKFGTIGNGWKSTLGDTQFWTSSNPV